MHPVFQEMLTRAMGKLEEDLAQEKGRNPGEEWDPDVLGTRGAPVHPTIGPSIPERMVFIAKR